MQILKIKFKDNKELTFNYVTNIKFYTLEFSGDTLLCIDTILFNTTLYANNIKEYVLD